MHEGWEHACRGGRCMRGGGLDAMKVGGFDMMKVGGLDGMKVGASTG